MTLQELRYIAALNRFGHFGKAAEYCHISQPTLSIAVKKLEDSLGVTLFERSKNQISATPIGLKIVQQAEQVLAQTDHIKELASGAKNSLSDPLKIGAIYTIGPYLFPHLIPELAKQAPEMPLVIEETYTGNLRKKLAQHELDLIIIALPFTEPDVVVKPLYEEPFVLLLNKKHPLNEHKTIRTCDLGQADSSDLLMLGEGHCFRDQVLEACPQLHSEGGSLLTQQEATSLDTLKHMVASGLGYTVLPLSAANPESINPELLTIRHFEDAPTRTVALAWRATFPRFAAIDAVSNAVTRCEVLA